MIAPTALFIAALLVADGGPVAGEQAAAPELSALVERIATGKDEDGTAADALVDGVITPLVEALGPLGDRPIEQQKRLHAALSRVNGALRVQLLRVELPEADRALLDAFAARHPALVEQLFADQTEQRVAALRRVPLEPNSGAGVLIAAKVEDWDFDVIEVAFEISYQLHDPVVARGLTRLMRGWNAAMRENAFESDEMTYRIVLAHMIDKTARVCARAKATDSVPALLESLELLRASAARSKLIRIEGVVEALGWIGDERSADPLIELLPDRTLVGQVALGPGRRAVQTLGDVALLSLCRIYDLQPAQLGVAIGKGGESRGGFESSEAREEAHRAFVLWHRDNADKPASERAAPTTQPAKTP